MPRFIRKPFLLGLVFLALLALIPATGPLIWHKPQAEAYSPAVRGTGSVAVTRSAAPGSLNVVEVLADDMRVDDLRYAPNLRNLVAAKGITIENGFSPYPLCCPARASFFSGELTHNHKVYTVWAPYGYRAFDDRHTIATSLKSVGYRTGYVGKYMNNYGSDIALAPRLKWRQTHPNGDWANAPKIQSQRYVPDGWDDWKAGIMGVGCKPACGDLHNYFHYTYTDNGVPKSAPRGVYGTKVMGDQAVTMATKFHRNRVSDGKPFLMSVNFLAPHNGGSDHRVPSKVSYTKPNGTKGTLKFPAAPKWALDLPMIRNISHAPGFAADGTTEADVSDKPGKWATFPRMTPSMFRADRVVAQHRAASVYVMDQHIGRLIKQLKSDGEWDRTVFVFWSDNGFFQGEHRRLDGKGTSYEPALRVPMLVTGPGMRDGTHRYDPVNVTDLTATILDIADAPNPHQPDGRSLLPVLHTGDQGWVNAVQIETAISAPTSTTEAARADGYPAGPRTSIGVRTARYTYTRFRNGAFELYDNWNDPNQWNNLYRDTAWRRSNEPTLTALETVWNQTKNCVGVQDCELPLPPILAATAQENQLHTVKSHEAVRRTMR